MEKKITTKKKYIEAIGRRKTATARVRLTPATRTTYTINEKDFTTYFPTSELQMIVASPFVSTGEKAHYSVSIKVAGGGIHSQAEAVRHGISRALVMEHEDLKPRLKENGFIKRDPRSKERRKFGLKKARKAPQWSKR